MPVTNIHEGLTINGVLPHVDATAEDFFDTENSKFLYARGFLLCKNSDITINSHFSKTDVENGYFLYYHELLKPMISSDKAQGYSVVLMGTAYFTDEAYISEGKTEADILREKLIISENELYKALDYLAGRYALICKMPKKMFAVNDACGMRTIFYCPDEECIGSHLELVNMVAKKGLSEIELHSIKNQYSYCYAYPANLTKYENIFMLIPNFSLSLNSFEIKRFFPREKISKTENVWEVKKQYFNKMRISMEQLTKKGKRLCFSLTGGKDSKVTFYSSKEYKDKICFFTESRDDDLIKSQSVVSDNDLQWVGTDSKDIKLNDNRYNKAFYDFIDRNVFPPSARMSLRNQFWNFNIFGANDAFIHINSNCAEAGRGRPGDDVVFMPFGSDTYNIDRFTEIYFISTYRWSSREIKEKQSSMMKNDDYLKGIIKDYFNILDHKTLISMGYNPWDFSYIEQRIAFLLSQQYMCCDCIYDSVSLTDSRDVLMIMWQLPEKYTINGTNVLYDCILNEYDPDFREMHMGKSFVPTNTAEEKDNYSLVYTGYLLDKDMNPEGKIKIAEKALQINKTIKWAHNQLIDCYVKLGKSAKAAEDWDIINSYDPEFACEFIYCGDGICNGLRELNKNESARCMINYALQKNPNCSWAYKQLSHIAGADGDMWVALALAEKAFSLNSDDRWTAQNYIMLLLKMQQLEKATKITSDALRKNKNKFWPNHCSAICLFHKGEYKNALEYSIAALNICPSDKGAIAWNKRIIDMIK